MLIKESIFVILSNEFQTKYKTMIKKLKNLKKSQLRNTTQQFSHCTPGL